MKQQWINWVGGVALACGLVAQVSAAEKITVFAAASLTNALQDIATEYQKGKDVEVVSSFASSSTLARQIEQGHLRICLSLPISNGWITPSISSRW